MTMAVMEAEVSRVLAAFVTDMGLGQDAARALAGEYATASVGDLPGWLTEDRTEPVQATLFPIEAKYNSSQPRDPGGEDGGRWVSGPAGKAVGALKDALKLAGKIDLAPGEKLLGSSKVDSGGGGIRMALTENGDGKRMLRLGAGTEGYGRRDPDLGTAAWDGNPTREPLSSTERQRLNDESAALDHEYEGASPARQAEIDARLEEIQALEQADDVGFNGTAVLDAYSMERLAAKVRPAMDEAVEQERAENAAWDEIEDLEAKGNPDPERMAQLRRIVEPAGRDRGIVFDEGILPGSKWGDVHYSVELDDPSVGAYLTIGVAPKGAPDDWGNGEDWTGQFDAAETRRFLRLLEQYAKGVQAAAGVDTHSGGEGLKHWWVYGAGSTRWSTFTELYDQLRKEITDMSDDHVKAIAASWYHLRYGIWPGSDANRVKHGKPPRGHVVGPG